MVSTKDFGAVPPKALQAERKKPSEKSESGKDSTPKKGGKKVVEEEEAKQDDKEASRFLFFLTF
jgi:hypothetical protein